MSLDERIDAVCSVAHIAVVVDVASRSFSSPLIFYRAKGVQCLNSPPPIRRKKAPLSTNLHVLFHRPMSEGLGHIEVKIINLGRKSATSEGRLFDPNQKLIATLLHSAQPVETGR